MKSHGMFGTRIYGIWGHMKQRCYNKNVERYKNYGGKGVKVCQEWQEFEPFYKWAIENGYDDSMSIERIDVNGDYCPENCKWITMEEQQNNTSRSRKISYNGETHTVADWARITGIPYKTLHQRLRYGWSDEEVLTTRHKSGYKQITYNGETHTIAEWARIYGMNYDKLKQRINRYGYSFEKAISKP